MRHKLFFVVFSLFCFRAIAQAAITSASLYGVWVIDSGAFPADIVKLKAYEAKDSSRSYSGYEFLKNGTIKIANHSAGKAFCGNGSPYIKKGTWFYKKQFIRLKVTGGYFAEGTYSYDLVYKIASFSNGLLVLRKTKTYKNKRCEMCND
ncbi:MAG: hypothetical protein HYU69_07895 [Bacteroidetes bacterium]|nr:hypothetical protein [Bacteroidota bacterium]